MCKQRPVYTPTTYSVHVVNQENKKAKTFTFIYYGETMKRNITMCAAIFMTVSMFAQAPQKMSYLAVISNSSNAPEVSTPVSVQLKLLAQQDYCQVVQRQKTHHTGMAQAG